MSFGIFNTPLQCLCRLICPELPFWVATINYLWDRNRCMAINVFFGRSHIALEQTVFRLAFLCAKQCHYNEMHNVLTLNISNVALIGANAACLWVLTIRSQRMLSALAIRTNSHTRTLITNYLPMIYSSLANDWMRQMWRLCVETVNRRADCAQTCRCTFLSNSSQLFINIASHNR